ncbi:MAG: RagB/SusD family nutrient uptake outer membrane protein, partial [Tannerellaceae bacterium]|nr:RagB/SusD family nutrient uptake outer membrane protein [Tannerellaceae bacterium]
MKPIIILIVTLLAVTSCADELDLEPANAITTEQIKEILASGDSAKIDQILGGIANNLPYIIHRDQGSGDSRSNGLLNLNYVNNLLGYDIVCGENATSFGWDAYTSYSSRRNATSNHNVYYWRFGWKCVAEANKLLYYLPEVIDNRQLKDYKARALTLRAFAYNFLMENYREAYQSGNVGLMIYDKLGEGTYKPYASAGETYDFIRQDISEAVRLFAEIGIGENRDGYTTDTRDIDLGVANFVLARVSLLTGDYNTVIAACNAILEKYPAFISKENYGGVNTGTQEAPEFHANTNAFFSNALNPEVIFGFPNITAPNPVPTWLNVFGLGYGGETGDYARIVSTLYDAIAPGDIRKGAFMGNTTFEGYEYPTTPAVSYRTVPTYGNLKFAATHGLTLDEKTSADLSKSDVCYMRSSEVLLMKAEAQAQSGNDAAAKTTLNTLLEARTDGLTCDTYPGMGNLSALDMVKLQWRIEMWGENGLEYYNNKRWGVSVVRSTSTSNHRINATIGVDLMTLEIPSNETLLNPNL